MLSVNNGKGKGKEGKKKRNSLVEGQRHSALGQSLSSEGFGIGDHKVNGVLSPGKASGRQTSGAIQTEEGDSVDYGLQNGEFSQVEGTKAAKSVLQAMLLRDRSISKSAGPTSSLNTDKELLKGFPRDCGRPGGVNYLSLSKALYERSFRHPHMRNAAIEADLEEGNLPGKNFDQVPLNMNFGNHAFDWYMALVDRYAPKYKKWLGAAEEGEFDLYQYGLGVPLYFKMLKYYSIVFCFLFFLTIPALVFFSKGSGMTNADRAIYRSQIALNDFFYTTMGTFGEARYLCRREREGETFNLECPLAGQTLKALKAFYGHPLGDCLCPVDQRVDNLAVCPTEPIGSSYCPPQNGTGLPSYCFRGEMPDTGAPCCSTFLAPNELEGDLRDLALADNPECNLEGVQEALEMHCLGKRFCTITVAEEFFGTYGATLWTGNSTLSCGQGPKDLALVGTCFSTTVGATGNPKLSVIKVLSFMDFVTIILFGVSTYFLYRWQRQQANEVNKGITSADDYTLKITNLPYYEDFEDLESALTNYFAEFFEILDHSEMICKVVEINFALPMKHEVSILQKRGVTARKIDELNSHLELLEGFKTRFKEHDDAESNASLGSLEDYDRIAVDHQIDAVKEVLKDCEKKFQKYSEMLEEIIEDKATDEKSGVVDMEYDPFESQTAFVTFATQGEKLLFREKFFNCFPFTKFCRPKHSDFKGKQIRVEDCSPPAAVVWENLGYSLWSRVVRQFSAFMMTFCVMASAFIFMYIIKKYHAALLLSHPPNDCSGQTVVFEPDEDIKYTSEYLTPQDVVRDYRYEFFGLERGNSGKLECFCRQLYYESGYTEMIEFAFDDPSVAGVSFLCEGWAHHFSMANKSTMMGVFGVLLTNVIIDKILRSLILPHEKLHSLRSKEVSLVLKSFISQTVNIAGIGLVINGNLKYFDAKNNSWIFLKIDWTLFTGLYKDLGEGWFLDVGVTILITMLMNIFTQHFYPLWQYSVQKFKILYDRNFNLDNTGYTKMAAQYQLENLYMGPEMHFEERFAAILVHLYVTLIYCAGMPLLIALCALNFFVQYKVDKFLLLRFYRSPEMIDERLAQLTISLLPLAVFLHCIITMWTFTNEDIFIQDDSYVRTFERYSNSVTGTNENRGYISRRFFNLNVVPQATIFLLICLIFMLQIMGRLSNVLGLRKSGFCKKLRKTLLQERDSICSDPYFQVLPTHHLKAHTVMNVLRPEVLEQYKKEMKRRIKYAEMHDGQEPMNRIMIGLPTYNYVGNPRYLKSYSLDSKCIMDYNKKKREQSKLAAKARGSATAIAVEGNPRVSAQIMKSVRDSITKRFSATNNMADNYDPKDMGDPQRDVREASKSLGSKKGDEKKFRRSFVDRLHIKK